MTQPTHTTESLIKRLKKENIPFELDEDGNVKATPEVVKFLDSKEALHRPDAPVTKTKEELVNPEPDADEDDDPGYDFTRHDTKEEVESLLDGGDYETGPSELRPKSKEHTSVEAYIGPIKELQGETCICHRNPDTDPDGVAVQFDDPLMVLNGRALGFGWHDFPKDHFSDTRPFFSQWRDIPSKARAGVRKMRGIPRIKPDGTGFQSRKQSRKGVPGAFGGVTAKRQRVEFMERSALSTYLLNVVCEDEEHSKTVSVKAQSLKQAKVTVWLKHRKDFPDQCIKDIEEHEEVAS